MTVLSDLSLLSQLSLYVLLALIGVITAVVLRAQIGCIRGRPFANPDGTTDDWREQKILYGMAWADVALACPASLAGLVLTFTMPRWGLFILSMVSFWLLWANLMTTTTSLRFEKPALSAQWIIVFPLGAFVGLAYLAWMYAHFDLIFGG
jgi:hypothetical protein